MPQAQKPFTEVLTYHLANVNVNIIIMAKLLSKKPTDPDQIGGFQPVRCIF
jgi:hypothetical protein